MVSNTPVKVAPLSVPVTPVVSNSDDVKNRTLVNDITLNIVVRILPLVI